MTNNIIRVYHPGDINKVKTTITLKLGTKNKLLNIANKGESFDDVINRIIRTNEMLENKNDKYQQIIGENNITNINRIESYHYNKGISSIKLTDDSVIRFSYNKPIDLFEEDYTMDIHVDEIFSNNKYQLNMNDITKDKQLYVNIYFRIIEKIINLHFDSSFSLSRRKRKMDPMFWKKTWKRIGLSDHSFNYDIMKFINRTMEEMNE